MKNLGSNSLSPTYSKEKIKLENPNIRSTKRWLRELTLHLTSSRLVFLFLYQLWFKGKEAD